MSISEKTIERHGAKVAKQHGLWALKLGMLGGRGWPDHTILGHGGRIAFIEYKVPGGAFQPLQKLMHRRLRKLGFTVVVIDSKQGVDEFFRDWIGHEANKKEQEV